MHTNETVPRKDKIFVFPGPKISYWKILNSDNDQKKQILDAIILAMIFFVEHFDKLGDIPEEELLHTFDNELIHVYRMIWKISQQTKF